MMFIKSIRIFFCVIRISKFSSKKFKIIFTLKISEKVYLSVFTSYFNKVSIKSIWISGSLSQWLRAFSSFSEDQWSVPNSYMAAQNNWHLHFHDMPCPLLTLTGSMYVCGVHIQAKNHIHTVKIIKFLKQNLFR